MKQLTVEIANKELSKDMSEKERERETKTGASFNSLFPHFPQGHTPNVEPEERGGIRLRASSLLPSSPFHRASPSQSQIVSRPSSAPSPPSAASRYPLENGFLVSTPAFFRENLSAPPLPQGLPEAPSSGLCLHSTSLGDSPPSPHRSGPTSAVSRPGM